MRFFKFFAFCCHEGLLAEVFSRWVVFRYYNKLPYEIYSETYPFRIVLSNIELELSASSPVSWLGVQLAGYQLVGS